MCPGGREKPCSRVERVVLRFGVDFEIVDSDRQPGAKLCTRRIRISADYWARAAGDRREHLEGARGVLTRNA